MMEDGKGTWKGENGRWRGEDKDRSVVHFPFSVSHWAPVLLWMVGIFYFSSRRDPLGFLPSSSSGHGINIGNLAHIGEYAWLAALFYRALAGGQQAARDTERPARDNPGAPGSDPPPPGRRAFALSFAMALAYAVSDELHQNLVPGRGGKLVDVGYDIAGMAAALGLIWLRGRFLASKANTRRLALRE